MTVRRETVHETEVFQGKLSGAPSRQAGGGVGRLSLRLRSQVGAWFLPGQIRKFQGLHAPEIWRGPRSEVVLCG